MGKKMSLRREVLGDLKDKLELHKKGEFLEEPSEEEMKERESERERRKQELEAVEKALRGNQVKFLATNKELDEIKKYARLERKSQSEFIRSCIWEKINSLTTQPQKKMSKGARKVSYNERPGKLKSELEAIKERLRTLTRLERKEIKMLAGLEIRDKELKGKLEAIKRRLLR
jgi:hypothetical protein